MNVRKLAAIANLSHTAISLALRGSPKVSKVTQLRVRELAQKHGYIADAKIASAMRMIRRPREQRESACFGVISLYPEIRPWEKSLHLKRIFEGMANRAKELGYRLEPIWLTAPGMSYRRIRRVLDTRGIEGLLCFGSPVFDDAFPAELDHYAIVTVGLSISTPLHRVTSHFYNDTISALNRLYDLGYRRPGLVISNYENTRTSYIHSAAYLSWCDRMYVQPKPVLGLNTAEEAIFLKWLKAQNPDAILFVHHFQALMELQMVLKQNRVSIPRDVGIAALSHNLKGTGISGMQQNQQLMGAWSVELLAARIANRDFGFPKFPRTEMVESEWLDGHSLRRVNRK